MYSHEFISSSYRLAGYTLCLTYTMASTRASTDEQHEHASSDLDKNQKRFVSITSGFIVTRLFFRVKETP